MEVFRGRNIYGMPAVNGTGQLLKRTVGREVARILRIRIL
jgi:hypothetical protein